MYPIEISYGYVKHTIEARWYGLHLYPNKLLGVMGYNICQTKMRLMP